MFAYARGDQFSGNVATFQLFSVRARGVLAIEERRSGNTKSNDMGVGNSTRLSPVDNIYSKANNSFCNLFYS